MGFPVLLEHAFAVEAVAEEEREAGGIVWVDVGHQAMQRELIEAVIGDEFYRA